MLGWFAGAGLAPVQVETLEGGELTVKLWLGAQDRRADARRGEGGMTSRVDQLEEARRAARAAAVRRCGGRRAGVASNSSRPRREKMEETLVGGGADARAARAALRLGDLWRGRIDPRAHPRHGGAHPARDAAAGRRASHLRRGDRRPRSMRSPRNIGRRACAISSRCAAIRRCSGARFQPHPGGYANAAELVAGLKRLHPFEISVAAYPECHPDSPDDAADHRQSQAQDRRGRDAGDHSVLLRARDLLPLPRRGGGGRDHAEIVPGIMPVIELSRRRGECRGEVRHGGARVDGPAVRGARRSPRRAPARRGDARGRDVPPALRGRRAQLPFLHAQPGRTELRDLPFARHPRASPTCKVQAA